MTHPNHPIQAGDCVVVLLGGQSAEREVSLMTGEACARALEARGYRVERVDADASLGETLATLHPRVVFNALHGTFGEDGCVQGLLECARIPYTGSGVLASALAMSKITSKRVFSAAGLKSPAYQVITGSQAQSAGDGTTAARLIELPGPWVVKPDCEGSSVGISIVVDPATLGEALRLAAARGGDVLVEAFVSGRELSVAVLEGEALGSIEIVPAREFYDYEAKYADGSETRYLFPPQLDEAQRVALHRRAERAFEVLGCRGVIRPDFILDAQGEPLLLEVNTLPGMTSHSLVPKIAAGCGLSFEELCERILKSARLDNRETA